MNKNILSLFIIIIISMFCLSIVFADNNKDEIINETEEPIGDITPISIDNTHVTFSDNFIGFSINSAKNKLTKQDTFIAKPTTNIENNLGNYLKSAVVECYKLNKETDIGKIIASFSDGSYQSSDNEIINNVLNSNEVINDYYVVKINNTTEATFNFELLNSVNNETSDYFAYSVSLKTIKNSENKLTTTNDNDSNTADGTISIDNTTSNDNESINNNTNNLNEDNTKNESNINQTNKTIINKTNTIIINQNNTTIINQNNIKTINNTTNDTPENSEDNTLMNTAGNPIFILIVVIIIAAITAVIYHKKD